MGKLSFNWRKLLAAAMAAVLLNGCYYIPVAADASQEADHADTVSASDAKYVNQASVNQETKKIMVHSRVGGAQWTPVLDLSDTYMRSKIDFYVQYEGSLVNELVGDAYAIQWVQEDGTVLSGSPQKAGNYTVKIVLDESLVGVAELVENADSFSFKVSKMNLSNSILGLYGGKPGQPQWTGEPIMPEEPYVANSSFTLPEENYELMFIEGKNCVEPGMAYVKAVVRGPNVEGEKEFQYQIIKRRLDSAYFQEQMAKSFAYDGTAKTPLLEGEYENISSVEYLYYFDKNDTRLEGAPKDAGNYSCGLRINPKDTAHYSNVTWRQEFTITPRKLEADIQVEKSKVYDSGTKIENPKVTFKHAVSGDEVNVSASAKYDNKNVGKNKTITVSYALSGKDAGNYVAPDEILFTDGEIVPREVEAGNIVLQPYYYNGSREVPLDDTAVTDKKHWDLVGKFSADDVAMDISEVKAFMEDADAGVGKPVTFSGFKLMGADSGNYTLSQPKGTVTILQIEFSNAYAVSMDDYQYGSAVSVPTLPLYEGDGQIVYKYREADSGQAYREWKDIAPESLKPGKYEMIAEVSDTLNYKGGTTVYPEEFHVKRFSPQIKGAETWEKTYGDEPFYLDVTQKGDGQLRYQVIRGEDVVSLDADGKVTILNAGEARVYVSASQTEFYEKEGIWIDITVLKSEKPQNIPIGENTEIKAAKTMDKLGDVPLPEGWRWKTADTKLIPGGILTAEAVYRDTANYEQYQVQIQISKKAEIITAATDRVFTIGKDDKAVIKSTGALSEFKGVAIDGVGVESTNYALEEGSTILTFAKAYLNELSLGKHKITLSYTAGDVETTLTVKEKKSGNENPPTDKRPGNPQDNPPTDKPSENPQDNPPTDKPRENPQDNPPADNPSANNPEGDNAQSTDGTAQNIRTTGTARAKTGDDNFLWTYLVLLLSSAGLMAAMVVRRRGKND